MMKRILLILFFCLAYADLSYVYADESGKIDVFDTDSVSLVVTMDTIYELNNEYINGSIVNNDSKFLKKNSIRIMNTGMPEEVISPDGYKEWICLHYVENGSSPLPHITLKHKFTGETFELSVKREDLEEYFQRTLEVSRDIREKVRYIQENLSDSDYGGVYYNISDGYVHVYIKDEALNVRLSSLGYRCDKADYSREELYIKLQELWTQREESGINYIELNNCTNRLDVYGECEENDMYHVVNGVVIQPGNNWISLSTEKTNSLNTDDIITLIECLKAVMLDEIQEYEMIEKGLEVLKGEYPGYECRNLLYRITFDGGYERYINFDRELLEFVSMLPEYVPNEKDPVEEMMFGDPERIELKSQLREYKIQYPDMDYREIYEKYLYDWEEYSQKSREEKQFLLNLTRSSRIIEKDSFNSTRNKSENIIQPVVIAGSGILIMGCIGIRFFKHRKRKD